MGWFHLYSLMWLVKRITQRCEDFINPKSLYMVLLLTIREHLGLPLVFWWGLCCSFFFKVSCGEGYSYSFFFAYDVGIAWYCYQDPNTTYQYHYMLKFREKQKNKTEIHDIPE
jgi:hypothetical protein